jgi:hypothetical protein
MVCKRSVNNVDGQGNTRIDFLTTSGDWKKPFKEAKCMFPTLDEALHAAAKVVGLSNNCDPCGTPRGEKCWGHCVSSLSNGSDQGHSPAKETL